MKRIPIEHGHYAMVDDDDFEKLSQYKWYPALGRRANSVYAWRRECSGGRQKYIAMHSAVLPHESGIFVAHINHNTLDNRKTNLRLCSISQNNSNVRLRKNSKSGFKGVSWCSRTRKWRSTIQVNGKQIYIGIFANTIDAAVAYDSMADKVHGEFALTNRAMGLLKGKHVQ